MELEIAENLGSGRLQGAALPLLLSGVNALEQTLAMTTRLGLKKLTLREMHLPLASSEQEIQMAADKIRQAGLDPDSCEEAKRTMNTTQGARVGSANSQETVQTVLLILLSVVGTWIALFRVPWHVSGDPCLVAAAATGVITACLWLSRWQGSRGASFERYLLAAFLVFMALVYVMRYLFVSTGRAASSWLCVEILGVPIFTALAVLGVKRSPWFLAIGIAVHGLAWDSWHYRNSTYMPDWYIFACLAVDVTLGAYVAARIPAYQRASR